LPHQIISDALPKGLVLTYQYATVFMAILVTAILALVAFLATRNLRLIPRRGQALFELIVSAFQNLVNSAMGPRDGRTFLPLIGTIFLFLWISNMFCVIPAADIIHELTGKTDLYFKLGAHTLIIPGIQEPTRNVNTPWALGIMIFFIMHSAAVLRKGPAHYFNEYFEPHLGALTWRLDKPVVRILAALLLAGVWAGLARLICLILGLAGRSATMAAGTVGVASLIWCFVRLSHEPRRVGLPNVIMFPLNVVGKGAEILSMSFRLFGNIFGGAIIIALLGSMTGQVVLPIFLQMFLGIFVGTIQAFVFTMLSMTYIAVELGGGQEDRKKHEHQAAPVEAAH
jgi:F0F1-type ATP synthase membrane subunit a